MSDSSQKSLSAVEVIENWERAVVPIVDQFTTDYLSEPSLYEFAVDASELRDAAVLLENSAAYYLPGERLDRLHALLHQLRDSVEQAKHWHELGSEPQLSELAGSAGYPSNVSGTRVHAKEQVFAFASSALRAVDQLRHALDDLKAAMGRRVESNSVRYAEARGPEPTLRVESITDPGAKVGKHLRKAQSKLLQTPGSKAVGAAYELKKRGERVNLSAACRLAGVDRGHVRTRYKEDADTIRLLAQADRAPPRGIRDARTGRTDAIDDPGGQLKSDRRRARPVGEEEDDD
jgi:hypothetical protein